MSSQWSFLCFCQPLSRDMHHFHNLSRCKWTSKPTLSFWYLWVAKWCALSCNWFVEGVCFRRRQKSNKNFNFQVIELFAMWFSEYRCWFACFWQYVNFDGIDERVPNQEVVWEEIKHFSKRGKHRIQKQLLGTEWSFSPWFLLVLPAVPSLILLFAQSIYSFLHFYWLLDILSFSLVFEKIPSLFPPKVTPLPISRSNFLVPHYPDDAKNYTFFNPHY